MEKGRIASSTPTVNRASRAVSVASKWADARAATRSPNSPVPAMNLVTHTNIKDVSGKRLCETFKNF